MSNNYIVIGSEAGINTPCRIQHIWNYFASRLEELKVFTKFAATENDKQAGLHRTG
jgi:hypothetical protein